MSHNYINQAYMIESYTNYRGWSTSNQKVGQVESNINFKNTKLTLPIYDVHDGHKTRLCYASCLQVVVGFTILAHVVCVTRCALFM